MRYPWYLEPRIGMAPRERANRLCEDAVRKIAWALPRRVAYWCAVRVISSATTGRYSNQVVPDLLALDALERWDKA